MAITIQELIASDTISQAVDKINFNFDQLLLNGGGPLGPAGPVGPPGPIGGRGERGTEWYEGTDNPNVTPPTTTPLPADYYLQSNGDVWEYTGLAWTNTGINLTGPQGATGNSGGWDFFGNSPYGTYAATAQNVGYPALMPTTANTITINNQGVRTFAVGIAGPNDNPAYPFGSPDTSVKISNTLAGALDASVVSMLVHQRNEAASGIKFMGGALPAALNYEQDDLALMSEISLGADDTLNINVPKDATSATTVNDTVGFNVFTQKRGQNFRSGGGVYFSTGTKTGGSTSAVDNSNFNITLNELNPLGSSQPPQFRLLTLGSSSETQFSMGGGVVENGTYAKTGDTYFDTRKFIIESSSTLSLITNGGSASLKSLTDNIELIASGNATMKGLNINIGGDAGSGGSAAGSVTIGTTGGDVSGVSIISGVTTPIAPGAKGIMINSTTGSVNIRANDPGVTGGIILNSGPDGDGRIEIASNNANWLGYANGTGEIRLGHGSSKIRIFSSGDKTNSKGSVYIGRGTLVGVNNTFRPTLIVDPDSGTYDGNSTTPTLHVGIGVSASVGTGLQRFYGGGEIIGPHGPNVATKFGSNPLTPVEHTGALHIRSGLNGNGLDPGAVWVYASPSTATGSYPVGNYERNSVRLWGTSITLPGTAAGTTASGVTVGLNLLGEGSDVGGDNVEGRTFMYGKSASDFSTSSRSQAAGSQDLDQDTDYPHTGGVNTYGGTNIGDRYRGRQTFKVWGDYVGDHYVSVFGGAQSGPGIEQQAFMSGAQGWSSKVVNAGTNNSDDDAGFKYRYQWQRTGRVVTCSGMVQIYVNLDGDPTNPGMGLTSQQCMQWQGDATALSNALNTVIIGPIPLPMNVVTGSSSGNTTDGNSSGNKQGAFTTNVSGTAVGIYDYGTANNREVTLKSYTNGTITSGNFMLTDMPCGVVGGGSAVAANFANSGSNEDYFWLKMFPFSFPLANGVIRTVTPGFIKFNFTYELNP